MPGNLYDTTYVIESIRVRKEVKFQLNTSLCEIIKNDLKGLLLPILLLLNTKYNITTITYLTYLVFLKQKAAVRYPAICINHSSYELSINVFFFRFALQIVQ
uniref:Uncharacterized protein n=1 Tax=Glossina brevipalpis TaxID=37001 RepID=A0A1A9WYG4_9MUSC